MAELAALDNVHRTPDLAVLAVGERLASAEPRPMSVTASPIIVARALPDAPKYDRDLLELHRRVNARWAVQAAGGSSKSDETFYRSMRISPRGALADVIEADPGPVVSVRLHGAVQAILAGVPAIHLAYERKSWGAFEDLGLSRWLHNARGFAPAKVAQQLEQLSSDSTEFWAAVRDQVPTLRAASQKLATSISSVLSG
jgi:hypothetical protein